MTPALSLSSIGPGVGFLAFVAIFVGILLYSYLEEKRLVGRRRRQKRWGHSSGSGGDASGGGWDGSDSSGDSGCGGGGSSCGGGGSSCGGGGSSCGGGGGCGGG